MTLKQVVDALGLTVRCGTDQLGQEVTGGYAGDLLSDVIAHGTSGSIWVTMQVHANIVAVAVLKDLAGILLVQGRQPADETVKKAAEEHVVLMVSDKPAFETIGRLSALIGTGP